MRPVRTALTAAGYSNLIPLDIDQSPFNVSVAVSLSAGASLTYTVEHTYDDIYAQGFDPSTAVWFSQAGLTSKTVKLDGNYNYPVRAVRLSVESHSGGTATMTVIQAGMPGR